jgi:hypothetical protein
MYHSVLDKEIWEPTLTHLFGLQSRPDDPIHIHEAWAIDAPNHGESAALNHHVLSQGNLISKCGTLMYPMRLTLYIFAAFRDYSRAIVAFFASGLLDLSMQSIIGIGHSAGTAPL